MPKISRDHQNKIRKKVSNRKKTRDFALPQFPDRIVQDYSKALINEVNAIDRLIKEILFPHLDKITGTKNERLDSKVRMDISLKELSGVRLVAELIRRIKSKFFAETLEEDQEPSQRLFARSARRISEKFLNQANQFAEKKFVTEFENQTGTKPLPQHLNVKDFIEDATRKNTNLIKTVPQKHFNDIQRLTEAAVSSGQLSSDLKKELIKVAKESKNRFRLIARDQIGKLVAVTSEARQLNLSVTHYIWKTSQDQRVRSFSNSNGSSDHARLNNALIPWSQAPITIFKGKRSGERNHAGMDINCRCGSQPVYDDITGIKHRETAKARAKSISLGLLN